MSTKNNKDNTNELPINPKTGNHWGMNPNSQKGWKNLEKGTWKKGQSGNPAGRPKNRVNEFLESCLTKRQVEENTALNGKDIDAIETIILSLDTKALQAIAKSENAPTYMRTLAMAAMWDMKNGKTQTMNLLRDRQFGAVKKNVDVTTNGQSIAQQSMTPKEARDFLKDIENEY